MIGFHDVRLPESIERGAVGGPSFSTSVLELRSGHEQRNINWSQARARYNIAYGISRKAELDAVLTFFYARRARAFGFRFKDWSDYIVPLQVLGFGNGTQKTFQAFKRYGDAVASYDRTLTKLVADTVSVFVEGVPVPFTVDVNTGLITLQNAPASTGGSGPSGAQAITYEAEFDVPVRFDADQLNITMELWDVGSVPSIELVEVRR